MALSSRGAMDAKKWRHRRVDKNEIFSVASELSCLWASAILVLKPLVDSVKSFIHAIELIVDLLKALVNPTEACLHLRAQISDIVLYIGQTRDDLSEDIFGSEFFGHVSSLQV